MNLTQEKINGSTVLFIKEERIDAHNSSDLKEAILHLIEQGEVNIIVQLEQVRFIDSSGLGALLSGYKNVAAKPCRVGNAFLPTMYIGKWWANDKAVCPPYTTIKSKVI